MATSGTICSLEGSSPGNDGPTVVVVAYVFLSFTVLVMIGRIAAALFSKKRDLKSAEKSLIVATLFAISQIIVTEQAVKHGLGRSMDTLDASQISSYYKLMYAGQILSIFSMALAKMSVIQLVREILGSSLTMPYLIQGTIMGVFLWLVLSFFALVFQCGIDHPWIYKSQKCLGGIWYAVVSFNVLSDAALAFLFAPTVWKLQMKRSKRVRVIGLFATRVVVCVAGSIQIVFLPSALHNNDQTRSRVNVTILEQLVMNLSILAASVPSLYRPIADLCSKKEGKLILASTEHLTPAETGSQKSGATGSFC